MLQGPASAGKALRSQCTSSIHVLLGGVALYGLDSIQMASLSSELKVYHVGMAVDIVGFACVTGAGKAVANSTLPLTRTLSHAARDTPEAVSLATV